MVQQADLARLGTARDEAVANTFRGNVAEAERGRAGNVVQSPDKTGSPERKIDERALRETLAQAEKVAQAFNRQLRFEVKTEADLIQVQVVNASDGKVIRKIPPDEVVRMVERVNELLGALFDVEA
jgi:flagellar protein FlaG